MSRPLEDYGLISDGRGAALVSKDGAIDWLCCPRFDSAAVFTRLLGDDDNGYWSLNPAEPFLTERRYTPGTLVIETRFMVPTGEVLVEDALIVNSPEPFLVRSVRGIRGTVNMETCIVLRPDYGSLVPWVSPTAYGLKAVAGPDEWNLQSPVSLGGDELKSLAAFEVHAGDELNFGLSWRYSHEGCFEPGRDMRQALSATRDHWRDFASRSKYAGPYGEAVQRSVLTLKSLIYAPTGAIVAAPTTSLPEEIGGERNWDYRYCWLRDSTFSFDALMLAGHEIEARRWIDWLVKALAGSAAQAHVLYGVAGERRLVETELPWLSGYENSRPVRSGNGAHDQLQMDVFGQVIDTFHDAVAFGVPVPDEAWRIQRCFIEFLERHWDEPDEGIWEIRGPRRHFTHSKVMAWVAVDRAIRSARKLGQQAPFDSWHALRERIHADVCDRGFSQRRNTFVQSYDSEALDASLLLLPMVGFLPADDPRIVGTVKAIEKHLTVGRYVRRYDTSASTDGVSGEEGAFLACSFWLADAWLLMGRKQEAKELFEHLLTLRNDLGLLAEEYDPGRRRLTGNFPQAFSHIALINTAFALEKANQT